MFGLKISSNNQLEFCGINFTPAPDINLEDRLNKLNELYRQVPVPDCNRCANCCGRQVGNPTMFSLEYVNIHRFINSSLSKDIRQKIYISATLSRGQLSEPRMAAANRCQDCGSDHRLYLCPCLDAQNNLCYIYPVRPLVCRVYGTEGWARDTASGWQKRDGARCPNVVISPDNRVEVWNMAVRQDLFRELGKLSDFYFWDEQTNKLVNEEQVLYWFSTQIKGLHNRE